MRYKLLALSAILLIGTPLSVSGQETSPLTVDTGKPVPSAVRSGEPFKITYTVKFVNDVVINLDQMAAENLSLENVEAIHLDVVRRDKDNGKAIGDDKIGMINVWDFTYTFRIIKPVKGDMYSVKPFKFIYQIKKAGVTNDETKDKAEIHEILTNERGIRYIDSVIGPPALDIRDQANFKPVRPFGLNGNQLRNRAYAVIVIGVLASVFSVFMFFRGASANANYAYGENQEDGEYLEESLAMPNLSKQAFIRELKAISDEVSLPAYNNATDQLRPFLVRLNSNLRDFLVTELAPHIQGFTMASLPSDMCSLLDKYDSKKLKVKNPEIYKKLAQRLKNYQERLDVCKLFSADELKKKLAETISLIVGRGD